ncbi:cell surface A33 antigen-like [Rhinoderma darwinii]|uniref:cell surface A33 antigen-like n=1 Tax=Rhinoderma darwinii TaxID=43563 RepID=UPI003F677C68
MDGSIILWRKMPEEFIVLGHLGNSNQSDDPFLNRVSFINTFRKNNASILIDQLKMEDNGTYTCEVTIPQDFKGTRLAKMELSVLVAPSKPVCGIVGSAEYYQDIKLTCNSQEGSPIPDYLWTTFTPQDAPRLLPPTAVIDKGELTLKNISMETSGFFICTSNNKVGRESCNITLAVMPPSMNIALYAGVIGGSIAGIIVIGIIAYCCCCRDKEDKEDYEMADREEEEEEPDNQPQQKKPQPQQQPQHNHQEDEFEDDDDIEENPPHKPPMPPANKPRLVLNTVDA